MESLDAVHFVSYFLPVSGPNTAAAHVCSSSSSPLFRYIFLSFLHNWHGIVKRRTVSKGKEKNTREKTDGIG